MIVSGSSVLVPGATTGPGWVRTEGDRIVEVGEGPAPAAPDVEFDGALGPGFVDIHAHGGGGASFTTGVAADARRVVATHLAHGTTALMASLVTDASPVLSAHVRELAPLVRAGELLGLHLEGPCLAPAYRGAHDPALLASPGREVLDDVLDAADGALRMVTIAPELAGGLEAVGRLTARGVVVAVGHTDASYEVTREALAGGATLATHAGNAMRGLHHREPGPLLALLEDDRAWIEVIADGVHLHPAVVRSFFAAAPGRVCLVTDAMSAAGAGDGDHLLGPLLVRVRDGVARVATTGAIAGSTLTLDAAVRFCVARAGVALDTAWRAASEQPARAVRRDDLGRLVPGARADLVALAPDATVLGVVRGGRRAA